MLFGFLVEDRLIWSVSQIEAARKIELRRATPWADGGSLLLEPGGVRPAGDEEGGKGGGGEELHFWDRWGGAGVMPALVPC